jgi:hypothetical protein
LESILIVAAGNFGKSYNVYEIGLAVRRRFHTVIDFSYPPSKVDTQLLVDRTGLLDTDSLINWCIKEKRNLRFFANSTTEMLNITAGDQSCQRDVIGNTNQGSLIGLFNALEVKNPTPEKATVDVPA